MIVLSDTLARFNHIEFERSEALRLEQFLNSPVSETEAVDSELGERCKTLSGSQKFAWPI